MNALDELKTKPNKSPLDWAVLEHYTNDAAVELAQLRTAPDEARKVIEDLVQYIKDNQLWDCVCDPEGDSSVGIDPTPQCECCAAAAWLKANKVNA